MTNNTELKIYELSIKYPKDWNIYIHPTIPFLFDGGSLKIENVVEDKEAQVSLGIRWTKTNKNINIDDYIEELKNQYSIKQKKNKKEFYEIINSTEIELSHKAYLIYSKIISNHGIFGILTKDESLESLQVCTFCDKTNRVIVASLTTSENNMKKNYDNYKNILCSLNCH